MIKLVVFDWNGVLIADAKACLDAENYILKKYGRKPISMNTYREFVSIPARNFFLQVGFSESDMEKHGRKMQNMFHDYYEPRIRNIRTRRNARRLLEWLAKRNTEMVILSNHTKEGIDEQLHRLGLEQYFTEILANQKETAMFEKNKRKRLQNFLKKRKLKRSEVLLIGDSPEEIEVGKELGVVTVSMAGGYYATRRLRELDPDFLAGNLGKVIDIIKRL